MMIDSYPFQIFPQPYVDPVRFSCHMCTKPDLLSMESTESVAATSPHEDTLQCTRLNAFTTYFTKMNSKYNYIRKDEYAYHWCLGLQ